MAVVLAEFEYGKYLIAPWYASMVNHTRQSGDITMVQMVWIVKTEASTIMTSLTSHAHMIAVLLPHSYFKLNTAGLVTH